MIVIVDHDIGGVVSTTIALAMMMNVIIIVLWTLIW
jgi:hypothetical protein